MLDQFLAGVGAGTIEAVVAVTPMETIKTKLIQKNLSLAKGVNIIIKEEGIGGIYGLNGAPKGGGSNDVSFVSGL